MRLKVTQRNLHKALSVVSRVAASRSTLPILSNILIKAEKSTVTLAATNLEIAITVSVPGKIEEEGSITVPARLMNDFVSSLPDETIDLSLENQSLKIKTEKYKSTINGVSAEEFPSLPEIKETKVQKIKSPVLKKALQQTIMAASSNEARQVLTGIYVHSYEDRLFFAATDSYRLAEKDVLEFKQDKEVKLIVPATALQEVLRILDDSDEEIEFVYDEGQIMFKLGEVELISRLIDGNYPDYRQLIPKESDISFTIKRSDFIDITKVSSLFARESAGSITLQVSEGSQEISIRSIASQVGDNTSKAQAEVTGDGEVTLNSRYLLDALNAFNSEHVSFSFSGKISPCIIRAAGEKTNDYLHIVMPLRS